MRYVSVRRVAAVGLALLFLLSVCSVSFGAKPVITANVVALKGAVKVTKADGTTETLTDTSRPILLPATIEMVGPKASFRISLPSVLTGKYNTVRWTLRLGETVRVSVLKADKGIKFEYLKGTPKFYLDVNNSENVLTVRSIIGKTRVIIMHNRVTVAEKGSALLTHPLNTFASITVVPGQISEIEFSYSPDDRYVEVLETTAHVTPIEVIPVIPPENIEESPYTP